MILNVCKQNLHISRAHISKGKECFNVKPSTNYFHMKTKIFADFQICISVPLGKCDPKKHCQFKLKLYTQTNSNMKNSMVIFIFFLFFFLKKKKTTLLTFFASLVQKIHLAF